MRADVMAAWVHPEEVAHSWFTSMMGVLMTSPRLGPYAAIKYGTDGMPGARNEAAQAFMQSGAEWLWWTDTDQGFTADTLDRLLAAADKDDRPIMGALNFALNEVTTDGMGGYRVKPIPALYRWVETDKGSGFSPIYDYPRGEVVECAGTGCGCIVIHRSVFEAIEKANGPVWYTRMMNPTTGQLIGEDLSFCARAKALGFPVCVDTSVTTNHLKTIWLHEADYAHPEVNGG